MSVLWRKKICKYFADFGINGEDVIVEDTKGVITQVFTLKKKLVEALYPGLVIQIIVDQESRLERSFIFIHYMHTADLSVKRCAVFKHLLHSFKVIVCFR